MVEDTEVKSKSCSETLKLLCSYGGKILPRSTDGNLRYVGGLTRVLAVDRSISFAELMVTLGEFCGYSVTLRCQLPNGDLETLISIKSDEELSSLLEEYDRAASGSKVRTILSPPASLKKVSPPASVDLPAAAAAKQPFTAVDRRSGSRPSFPPPIRRPVAAAAKRSFPVVDRVSRARPAPLAYGYLASGGVYYYPYHVQANADPRSLYCGPHKNYR